MRYWWTVALFILTACGSGSGGNHPPLVTGLHLWPGSVSMADYPLGGVYQAASFDSFDEDNDIAAFVLNIYRDGGPMVDSKTVESGYQGRMLIYYDLNTSFKAAYTFELYAVDSKGNISDKQYSTCTVTD